MAFVDATGIYLMATEGLTKKNGGIDALAQMVKARFDGDINLVACGEKMLAVERLIKPIILWLQFSCARLLP